MSPNKYYAHRLRELFIDGRWIARTNYREVLEGVNLGRATRKVADLNTMAALTYHINYYLEGLLKVLRGGPLEIRDKYSYDLPPLTTEEEWQELVDRLLTHAEAFAAAVEELPKERFAAPFVKEEYGDYRRNIDGVLEHSYYHLGQLVLLRKLTAGG